MSRNRLLYLSLLLVALVVLGAQLTSYYYLQRLYPSRGSSGNQPEVSILINYGNTTSKWFNVSNVPVGSNFYNLTSSVAHVEAIYYPYLDAHYIIGINGVRNDNDGIRCNFCWTLWVYCQKDLAWAVSPVGADLISLANGNILAWYFQYASSDQSVWKPPIAGANKVGICSG